MLEETMAKYQAAIRSICHNHITSHSRSLPLTYAECAHPVLVEALSTISSRALVYQVFLNFDHKLYFLFKFIIIFSFFLGMV
jgi:hypothetical protein